MADWTTYNSTFEQASKVYNIDKSLLLGLAKTESNFDTNATSGAGAKGIFQLMPATAKSLGVSDPYDPVQNIMGGAKYLSNLLKANDGDTDKALASFYAGSGNVAKYGAEKYSSYYNKVYKNQALYKTGQTISPGNSGDVPEGLEDAVNNLKENADKVVKDSDEKYWGSDESFTSKIVKTIILILLTIGGITFIALSIGQSTGINKKVGGTLKAVKKAKKGDIKGAVNDAIETAGEPKAGGGE